LVDERDTTGFGGREQLSGMALAAPHAANATNTAAVATDAVDSIHPFMHGTVMVTEVAMGGSRT
jgi:hypothetical protein